MHPDELTAAMLAGTMTRHQAIAIYNAIYGPQAATLEGAAQVPPLLVPCETCGRPHPLSHSVAFKLWTPNAGHPAVEGYDSPLECQHFGCSAACAAAATVRCLNEHIRPEAARRCAAAQAAKQATEQATPQTAGDVAHG